MIKWSHIKLNVLNCNKANDRDDCLKIFNEDIGYFLALLKLVVKDSKFENAIKSFITFTDVNILIIYILDSINHLYTY